MRRPQSVASSQLEGFTKEKVETACGTCKWDLKSVTVRPCRIWKAMSVVNKRVRQEGRTIQEFV